MTTEHKVKPCPVCGSFELMGETSSRSPYRQCAYCDFTHPQETWEEFYCWKLLDEAEKRVQAYREVIGRLVDLLKQTRPFRQGVLYGNAPAINLRIDQSIAEAERILNEPSSHSGKEDQ